MDSNKSIFSSSEKYQDKIEDIKSKVNDLMDETLELGAEAELDIAQKIIDTLYDLQNNALEYNFLDIDDFRRFHGIHMPKFEQGYISVVDYLLRNYSLKELKNMLDSYFRIRGSIKKEKMVGKMPTMKFNTASKNGRIYSSGTVLDSFKEKFYMDTLKVRPKNDNTIYTNLPTPPEVLKRILDEDRYSNC